MALERCGILLLRLPADNTHVPLATNWCAGGFAFRNQDMRLLKPPWFLVYSFSSVGCFKLYGDNRMRRLAALLAVMFVLASVSALACDGSGDKMKNDSKSGSQEKKT